MEALQTCATVIEEVFLHSRYARVLSMWEKTVLEPRTNSSKLQHLVFAAGSFEANNAVHVSADPPDEDMSTIKDFPEDVHECPVLYGHVEGIHQRFKRFKLRNHDAQAADIQPVIGRAHAIETLRKSPLDQIQQAIMPSDGKSSFAEDEILHAMLAGDLDQREPCTETRPRGKHSDCYQSLGSAREHEREPSISYHDPGSHVLSHHAPIYSSAVAQHPTGSPQVSNLSRQGSGQVHHESHYYPGVPAPPKSLALAVPDVAITSSLGTTCQHALAAQAAGEPNQAENHTHGSSAYSSQIRGNQLISRAAHVVPGTASRQQQYDLYIRNRQFQQHMYGSSHMPVSRTSIDVGPPDGSVSKGIPEHSLHPTLQNHRTAGVARPCWPRQLVTVGDLQAVSRPQLHPALKPKIRPTSRFMASLSSQRVLRSIMSCSSVLRHIIIAKLSVACFSGD